MISLIDNQWLIDNDYDTKINQQKPEVGFDNETNFLKQNDKFTCTFLSLAFFLTSQWSIRCRNRAGCGLARMCVCSI